MEDFDLEKSLKELKTEKEFGTKKTKRNKQTSNLTLNGIQIKHVESSTNHFEINDYQRRFIIPQFPFSLMIVGGTSSGKSTLLVNLFVNSDMYRGFFDKIYLFSTTGNSDGLFDHLNLDDENIITSDMIEKLDELLVELENESQVSGAEKMKKRCFIFEDLTANKKLMNSETFIKCFCTNRHLALAVIGSVHKYSGLNRVCRLQCNNIFAFPMAQTDISKIIEDHQPPTLSKKQFKKVIEYAHEPSEEYIKPFLHINNKVDFKQRYRKCLDSILELKDYSK